MTHKSLPTLFAAVLACSTVFAQKSEPKPLSEADLLKQIETLSPALKSATPAPTIAKGAAPAASDSLFNNSNLPGDLPQPSVDKNGQPTEKKAKGPTEITALEATFDQRKNVAVFIGNVIVKDPEFNVTCDKLTAHLKHDDKAADGTAGAPKATPKPAAPNQEGGTPVKKKQGGLESAFAERTTEKRVIITQDKVEADGSVTHGIGIADAANYNAITGDIVLTGMPDVTQGVNRCIATDPSTVMTLNRDGHMTAKGPHKTIITDSSDTRSSK